MVGGRGWESEGFTIMARGWERDLIYWKGDRRGVYCSGRREGFIIAKG